MFCGNCGSQIPAGSRFCAACGATVEAPSAPAPPPPPAAAPPQQTPPAWQQYSAPQAGYNPPPAYPQQTPAYPQQAGYPQQRPAYPQQQASYPQPQAYPQPAFAQPAYAQPAAQPAPTAGPIPPDMHWALVLVLAWFTAGLAGLVWAFRQASFVKKIDPSNKAVAMFVFALLGMVAQVVLYFVALGSRSMAMVATMGILTMVLNLVIFVAWLVGVFGMRSSLLRYYNSVEPIGLRLSGVMTFFFSILYFQYHFSRIANWKRTGQLS